MRGRGGREQAHPFKDSKKKKSVIQAGRLKAGDR